MAIFLWIYALMSPVSGLIADRVNRKWLVVGSLFVWSAVTMLMGFTTDFDHLYILRGIMGVSEALYMPAGLAMIVDYHQGKTRSLAVGIHMTGIYLGQAFGGFGSISATHFSWQTTFHVFGFIGIAYSLILIFFLKEKRNEEVTSKDRLTVQEQADRGPVLGAEIYGGRMALKLTAAVPATMAIGYLILVLYFRAKGGYRVEVLHGAKPEGEHYTGGMEGPGEG